MTAQNRCPERPGRPGSAVRALLRLLACLLVLLTGCDQAGRQTVTIRFWNGFTGPDGRTMLRMVKKFNAENPDVNVVMQRMDWATYYNKLFVAGMGKRAPEAFVIHTQALHRFARAGFLLGVDDMMTGPDGLDVNDLDPNVWQATMFEGTHYGVPMDVHPLGMYYNTRLFREAGIVDSEGQPAPPTNREEFLDAARRLARPAQGGNSAQWGYVFTWLQTNVYTIMSQFGGVFFTEDQSRCLLNDPRNVAALQFCTDLIRKEKVAPPPQNFDAWIGFRQGKVGIAFEGVYMLSDLAKQSDLEYAGAPVPVLGSQPAAWASSHNLCMRADLTDRERDATWRFLRFLSDNSLDWAEGGQVPVRRSLRRTPRFQAMSVQAQFAREIPYVKYLPQLPFIFEFQTEFDTAVESALRGTKTPQQALDTATNNINRIIARERANSAYQRRDR